MDQTRLRGTDSVGLPCTPRVAGLLDSKTVHKKTVISAASAQVLGAPVLILGIPASPKEDDVPVTDPPTQASQLPLSFPAFTLL